MDMKAALTELEGIYGGPIDLSAVPSIRRDWENDGHVASRSYLIEEKNGYGSVVRAKIIDKHGPADSKSGRLHYIILNGEGEFDIPDRGIVSVKSGNYVEIPPNLEFTYWNTLSEEEPLEILLLMPRWEPVEQELYAHLKV